VSIKPTIACECPVLPLPVLIREHIRVDSVLLGQIDHFEAGVLTVNAASEVDAGLEVVAVGVDVIAPGGRNVACDTVLDFFPIAVKADGAVGSGVTRIADGVVMMVTATEADGTQAGEFGDSHGILSERIDSSACGVPDDDVWIVRVAVTLRDGVAKIRSGPHAAHRAADTVAQRLRTTLLAAPTEAVTRRAEHEEPRRPGGLRVVYAKMVMGQGAMHEKLLLPAQPHGVRGGRSIIEGSRTRARHPKRWSMHASQWPTAPKARSPSPSSATDADLNIGRRNPVHGLSDSAAPSGRWLLAPVQCGR
jgi:D-proline reductase (dithiol) PrdA